MEQDQDLDVELIECSECKAVLNQKSLWIVADEDPKIYCELCYQLKYTEDGIRQ